MISECVEAGDLVLRETARKTYNSVKRFSNLKPPLGLPGPTIKIPIPPVFVPGKGLKQAEVVLETGFPQPELKDEIYAQGLLEVILGVAEVTLKNVNKDVKDVTVKNYNLTYSINEMD